MDDVDTCHHFSNCMFYLNTRIHFDEIEVVHPQREILLSLRLYTRYFFANLTAELHMSLAAHLPRKSTAQFDDFLVTTLN